MNEKDLQLYHFLHNEMSGEERNQFEAKLQQDEALRRDLAWHRAADLLLETAPLHEKQGSDAQKAEFRQLGRQLIQQQQQESGARIIPLYFVRAAAAILLIGFGLFLFNRFNTSAEEKLFTEFYSAPSLETTLGTSDDMIWQKAKKDFEKKQYADLIQPLNTLLASPNFQYHDEAFFMQGIAFLQEKDSPKALTAFTNISTKNIILRQNADWYAALAHLRAKDKDAAKKALQQIVQDSQHEKFSEAGKLLEKIG